MDKRSAERAFAVGRNIGRAERPRRKLVAKPEALRARGLEGIPNTRPTPDAIKEADDTKRTLNIALALVRIDDALGHANEARACLLFVTIDKKHPAVQAVDRCIAELRKAKAHAQEVLRVVTRLYT